MVGGIGMELKDYTTEELRAELKKRNAEERAKYGQGLTEQSL